MAVVSRSAAEVLFENTNMTDCGLAAFQAVTKKTRDETEAIFAARGAYDPKTGVSPTDLHSCLRLAGFKTERVEFTLGDSVATFALEHERGTYLVYTMTHVMALVEGDLYNSDHCWSDKVAAAVVVNRAA
jgi:hypothetical protein